MFVCLLQTVGDVDKAKSVLRDAVEKDPVSVYIVCMFDCLCLSVGWLVGWLVCLSVGWLVCLSVGWSVGWLVGRLVGRSVGWSVGRLSVGWLADLSVGWFVGLSVGLRVGPLRLTTQYAAKFL